MDKDIASLELNSYRDKVLEDARLLDDQYHMIVGDRTKYELVKSNDEDSKTVKVFKKTIPQDTPPNNKSS
jgi:hypothetical protein